MNDNPFATPGTPEPAAPTASAPQPYGTVAVASAPAETAPIEWPSTSAASPQQERPARARVGGGTVALIAAGALVVGGVGGFGAAVGYDALTTDDASNAGPVATLPVANSSEELARAEGSVAAISAAVLPSVVSIEATGAEGRTSTGSGFVIREDGYIATNNHVVEGADGDVSVLFSDGTVLDGEVVGATSDYDLAVIKVDKTGLTPLALGDSDAVVVGDSVIAIGSPLGLSSTVTTGIVSALHRPVTAGDSAESASFIDAIQTDAAINPGNSGGPLINSAGEVIGINSAIANLSAVGSAAGSVGLGFAIPSNQVRRTVEEIIATGTATYPVIGVQLDNSYDGEGVRVATDADGASGVVSGGPADEAGIEPGDVITQIDGRVITRGDELVVAIRAKAPGDTVTLTVLRDGEKQDIEVLLAADTTVNFGDEG